jgi:hypothetical protein
VPRFDDKTIAPRDSERLTRAVGPCELPIGGSASIFAVAMRRGCRTYPKRFASARSAPSDLPQASLRDPENVPYEVAFRLRGGRPTLCDSVCHERQRRAM